MADITQNVLIEFISDTTQLQPGVDKLAELGKIEQGAATAFKTTNTEINKQAAALKSVAAATSQIDATGKVTKKNIQDVATAVKGMSSTFQKEFKAGVVDELKKAGVSLKDFEKTLDSSFDKSETATLSLKSQLRQMVEQLAQLKVQGKDTGQEYLDLANKAGQLSDAIGDANQQVKNFGSDTSTFDGLIQGVSGLAGGYSVLQGAQALFGNESEELQKTLLRVNAAMAILQGLQQIQVVLQKESAASQLLNTIATKGQAAALGIYNFVVGSSIGLTKAFRIALAATGVGLLVLGLVKLIDVLNTTDDSLEAVNDELERQKNLTEALNKGIQDTVEVQVARAEAAGLAESRLIAIRGRGLQQQAEVTRQTIRDQLAQRDAIIEGTEGWIALNKAIGENNEVVKDLDRQTLLASIQFEKQLADERKEAAKKREDDAKKFAEDQKRRREEALQKEKEARAAGFADFKASVELELLAAEKGSQEELEIRKRLLRAELQLSLDNDKLTDNQRELLVKQFFKERLDLEKQFAKDRDKIILENIGSDVQAELQQLELTNEKRLELTETAIQLQAQMEVDGAEGNSAKITEINARRDRAIRDARLASIQQALDYELSLASATNGPAKRRLETILENGEIELEERKRVIDALASIDAAAIQKRIDALNQERKAGLISQKDYNLQYAQLTDEQVKIWEDAEKKKTAATDDETKKRGEHSKKELQNILLVADAVSNVFASLNDIASDRENQRLDEARRNLKDLQDAGAITEKDAIARAKRLDAEERKIKNQQAQREKALALFNAIISTAKGVAAAIPNPFLIALAAAIGAAQIAIIAARPVPRFGKGKKNQYEGLAEVGETGPELVEKNGRMYLEEKSKIIWLSKKDKVFNPIETRAMMSSHQMNTERAPVSNTTNNSIDINYDKIGKAVADNVQTNVIVDGVTAQVLKQQSFEKYLDAKRTF